MTDDGSLPMDGSSVHSSSGGLWSSSAWTVPAGRSDRLILLIVVTAYIGLLKWLYVGLIVPAYAYTGLRYAWPGAMPEILTWVFAVAPVAWLPIDIRRPSGLPLWFQYLIVYVPTTFVPLYNEAPADRSVWPLVATILCALVIVQALSALPQMKMPAPRLSAGAFRALLLGLAAVVLVPVLVTFGIPTHVPSLAEVYDVRSDYKATLASANIVVSYLITWLGRVIAPVILLEGLITRRWVLVVAGLLGALYIFSLSGMKTIALSGFFLIGLWMIYRPGGRRMGLLLTAAVCAVMVLCAIGDWWLGTSILVGLLIRRALVVPALLSGYYYQFFSVHPMVTLGSSFLRPLAGYPYDAPAPMLIGATYFGSLQINANVNVWGDAFANFGLLGILTFAVILGLVLWMFDSVAAGRSSVMTCLMLGVPALTLTNSALQTTLLTNGLALTFVVAALLPVAAATPGKLMADRPPPSRRAGVHRPTPRSARNYGS